MEPEGAQDLALEGESLEELDAFTRRLARQAGSLVMDSFLKPHQVEYKSGSRRNPVTETDRASEEYLVRAIEERYPDHAVLAEENPERTLKESPFLWVLDPLDGTTNFLNGMPLFAVSVALLYRGRPVTGCIFVPYPGIEGGSLFHARAGGGAFQDGHPLSVAPTPRPGAGHIAILPGRYSRFLFFKGAMSGNHGEVRALGSICYEATLVAQGIAHYSLFTGPRLWDVAAAVLLVQEAGGLALVGQGLRRWQPFEAFPYLYLASDGRGEDLSQWSRPVLAGNAAVASFVAASVRRRPLRLLRLRRWFRQRVLRRRQEPQTRRT